MSRVINQRTKSVVVEKLENANSFSQRLIGLMGRKDFSNGQGLLIKRSGNSIHTFFMHFAIDVAFVNKDGEVKYTAAAVKPWRIIVAPILTRTDCLELPAGTLSKTDTRIGDTLLVEA